VVVSVVNTDEPPSIDVVEFFVDEAFDAPPEALALLLFFYLYLNLYRCHKRYCYLFSR
jgi:hypothetical protein